MRFGSASNEIKNKVDCAMQAFVESQSLDCKLSVGLCLFQAGQCIQNKSFSSVNSNVSSNVFAQGILPGLVKLRDQEKRAFEDGKKRCLQDKHFSVCDVKEGIKYSCDKCRKPMFNYFWAGTNENQYCLACIDGVAAQDTVGCFQLKHQLFKADDLDRIVASLNSDSV